MKKTALLIAVCLLAVAARAIELSLEENRGERGSVGYVDIQRLFADSPDALKAKEGFEDLVRQAEERVNLRKAELLKLHHELDSTRADRDALALLMTTAPSTAAAAGVSASTSAAIALSTTAPAAVALSTRAPAAVAPAAVALSTTVPPGAAAAVSSATVRRELALPGMSTLGAVPTAPPVAAVAASSTPAPAPASVVTSTGVAAAAAMLFPSSVAPAPAPAPAPTGPTQVQRLLEFDGKIIKIQAEIADKESALTREHDSADRGLLDLESRKTDQVLARIYRAVSEVARREGVSVVIDRASILYGQTAVDLTDKVLKDLKEAPQQ